MPNEILLPDEPAWWSDNKTSLPMSALKITNPDAPLINVAINLPPSAGAPEILMAPALVSSQPYTNGAFFQTLEWIFLEVEITDGRAVLKTGKDGAPIVHKKDDLMAAYREKIGYYLTGELFHPDELLAQSFAEAAEQFQPALLEKIARSIWPSWPE